jgi:outer membrane protein
MYSQHILTIILLMISAPSFAAVDPAATSGNLTIDSAIKKGLDYSPDVQKAEDNLKAATATLNKARGAFFPTINAVGAATNKTNSTTSTTSTIPNSISSANGDTYQAGLTLNQPLYAGGLLTGGIGLYKSQEDIARQALFLAKETLLQSLLSAYYALVQSEMTLEAAQSNRDINKAFVDITNHYARIGRSRKMDELQAQANYSLSLVDTEQNQVLLYTNQSNMNRYLGDPKSTPVKSSYRVTINPIGNLTLDQALETAGKSNPTILTDVLNIAVVDYNKEIDLSQDMPSLSLAATGGYQAPDVPDMWVSSSQYYSVGLNLTVPLFSGLTSLSKRTIYENQKYAAEKQLQSDKDTLRVAIESALDNIKSTQVQLDLAVRSVKEARQALDLANKGYKEGTAAVTDVTANQTTRYTAEKIFITAQFAYLTALLTLRQQMGIDLEKAYAH